MDVGVFLVSSLLGKRQSSQDTTATRFYDEPKETVGSRIFFTGKFLHFTALHDTQLNTKLNVNNVTHQQTVLHNECL